MSRKFDVTGMTCSACSAHVEKSVSKLVGEGNVTVSLLTNSMQVECDDKKVSDYEIIKAVEDAGYGAAVAGAVKSSEKKESVVDNELKEMKTRLIVSFIFLISFDVCIYGVYGRSASAVVFKRTRQCGFFCLYPISYVSSYIVCEQKIFSGRI